MPEEEGDPDRSNLLATVPPTSPQPTPRSCAWPAPCREGARRLLTPAHSSILLLAPAEKERDASLNAILDRVVGLGWEKGWTPKLSQRCAEGEAAAAAARGWAQRALVPAAALPVQCPPGAAPGPACRAFRE